MSRSMPQVEDSAEGTYVKVLNRKIERGELVDTLIAKTKSLNKLVDACKSCMKELSGTERDQLMSVCLDRLDSVFAVTLFYKFSLSTLEIC